MIPDHLKEGDAARTGDEFDVNQYFSILDRLSMEPGYVLDYVYCFNGNDGLPRLYARPRAMQRMSVCSDLDESLDYLEHVRSDGTLEGFFQLVLMDVMGGQFYLFWHAYYWDRQVVCSKEGVERILISDLGGGGPFSPAQLRGARRIDPTPIFRVGEEVLTIEIVSFSKWGGFSKEVYEVNRQFPHNPVHTRSEVLVEYQSGTVY